MLTIFGDFDNFYNSWHCWQFFKKLNNVDNFLTIVTIFTFVVDNFDNIDQFGLITPFWHFLTILDKDQYRDINKDNPRDLWHLRHWLQFGQKRTWIYENLCDLAFLSVTGQHLRCLHCRFSLMAGLREGRVKIYIVKMVNLQVTLGPCKLCQNQKSFWIPSN